LGSDDSDEDEPNTETQGEKGKADSPKLPLKVEAVDGITPESTEAPNDFTKSSSITNASQLEDGITPLTTEALEAFTKSFQGRKPSFMKISPQWKGKEKRKLTNRILEAAPGVSFDSTAAPGLSFDSTAAPGLSLDSTGGWPAPGVSFQSTSAVEDSSLNPPVLLALDEVVLDEKFRDELVPESDVPNITSWLHKAPWSK